jgi:hypothetical protein
MPLEEYSDYLQDIVSSFDATYRTAIPLLKVLHDFPTSFSNELKQYVDAVLKSVEAIRLSFEEFSRGRSTFNTFKEVFLAHSDRLKALKEPSGMNGRKINPEIANIPKRNDERMSNIDLNSQMSAHMNKLNAYEDQQGGEDHIQLPEDYVEPAHAVVQNPASTGQSKNKGDFDDGDDNNDPQVAEATGYGGFMDMNFDDGGNLQQSKAGDVALPNMESSAFGGQDSKLKAETGTNGDLWVTPPKEPIHKPDIQTKQAIDLPKPTPVPLTDSSQSNNKENVRRFSGQMREDSAVSNPDALDNHPPVTAEAKKRLTEEEKIKILQKNEAAINDKKAQNALDAFFSAPEKAPQPKANDIFARAKARQMVTKRTDEVGQQQVTNVTPQNPQPVAPIPAFDPFSGYPQTTNQPQTQAPPTNFFDQPTTTQNPHSSQAQPPHQNFDPFAPRPDAEPLFPPPNVRPLNAEMKMIDAFSPPPPTIIENVVEEEEDEEKAADTGKEGYHENRGELDHEMGWNDGGGGGLMEDAHNDYFPEPDIDKMRAEIAKLEESRKNQQPPARSPKPRKEIENSDGKRESHKSSKTDPHGDPFAGEDVFAQSRAANTNRVPADVADFFSGTTVTRPADTNDFFAAPQSPSHNIVHPASPEQKGSKLLNQRSVNPRMLNLKEVENQVNQNPFQVAPPPHSHHLPPQNNRSLQSSDFFQNQNHPSAQATTNHNIKPPQIGATKLESSGTFFIPQSPRQAQEDSAHSNQPSQTHLQPPSPAQAQTPNDSHHDNHLQQPRFDPSILSDNNRLKQENSYLVQQLRVLEEQLSSALQKNKELPDKETIEAQLAALQKQVGRETLEKELFEQKYKALYERWKRKEVEDQQRSELFDPSKIIELSKLNETLVHEKRELTVLLLEEREKSKYVDHFKEELNKTRQELLEVTRAFHDHVADTSKINLHPEESILKELSTYKPPKMIPASTMTPPLPQPVNPPERVVQPNQSNLRPSSSNHILNDLANQNSFGLNAKNQSRMSSVAVPLDKQPIPNHNFTHIEPQQPLSPILTQTPLQPMHVRARSPPPEQFKAHQPHYSSIGVSTVPPQNVLETSSAHKWSSVPNPRQDSSHQREAAAFASNNSRGPEQPLYLSVEPTNGGFGESRRQVETGVRAREFQDSRVYVGGEGPRDGFTLDDSDLSFLDNFNKEIEEVFKAVQTPIKRNVERKEPRQKTYSELLLKESVPIKQSTNTIRELPAHKSWYNESPEEFRALDAPLSHILATKPDKESRTLTFTAPASSQHQFENLLEPFPSIYPSIPLPSKNGYGSTPSNFHGLPTSNLLARQYKSDHRAAPRITSPTIHLSPRTSLK